MSDYDSCPKSTLYLDNRQIKGIQTGQKGYRNFLEILFARSRHSLNCVVAPELLANQVSQLRCSLVQNFAETIQREV